MSGKSSKNQRAQAVRRAYLQKKEGTGRPLDIPAPKHEIPEDAVVVELSEEELLDLTDPPFDMGVTRDLLERIEKSIRLGRALPPLSEEERIQHALRFANTRRREAWELLIAGARLPPPLLKKLCSRPEGAPRTNTETGEVTTWLERQYQALKEDLRSIAEGEVTRYQKREWQRHAELGLLTYERGKGFWHITHARFELPPIPAVAYVQCRLLERGDLGMCRWCGKFFIAKSRGMGRTIRRYCPSTDHDERAFRAGAAERMARMRRKRKSAKK
jgi:hypothetical protein